MLISVCPGLDLAEFMSSVNADSHGPFISSQVLLKSLLDAFCVHLIKNAAPIMSNCSISERDCETLNADDMVNDMVIEALLSGVQHIPGDGLCVVLV